MISGEYATYPGRAASGVRQLSTTDRITSNTLGKTKTSPLGKKNQPAFQNDRREPYDVRNGLDVRGYQGRKGFWRDNEIEEIRACLSPTMKALATRRAVLSHVSVRADAGVFFFHVLSLIFNFTVT